MKQNVAIIGVGLIGGSLGQALRHSKRYNVLGIARKPSTLREAKRLGAIDEGSTSLSDVSQADIVVICTPVDSIAPLISKLRLFLKPLAIVTDVGSVKRIFDKPIRGVRFVGSHPLAGSHKTGVKAARPDLFKGATCVVVPRDLSALKTICTLWKTVGAHVIKMPAQAHDDAVAFTSHLPHVIAHALVHCVMDHKDQKHLKLLLAGSFRDVTRVAASDPEQWRQILQSNIPAVRSAIRSFKKELTRFESNLSKPALKKLLIKSHIFRAPLFNEK